MSELHKSIYKGLYEWRKKWNSAYRSSGKGEILRGGGEGKGEGEGKMKELLSIELCSVGGIMPGTLHTLSHLTLRTALK